MDIKDITQKEAEVLVEALEEWEQNKEGAGGVILPMMLRSIAGDDPEALKKIEESEANRELERRKENLRRKRLSTLLKGKIYEAVESDTIDSITKRE